MKRLTILLFQLIIDPERDPDFTAMDPPEIDQILQDLYAFLPPSVIISVDQDTVILQSDEDVNFVGTALKWYSRAVNAAKQAGYQKAIEPFEKVLKMAPFLAGRHDSLGLWMERLTRDSVSPSSNPTSGHISSLTFPPSHAKIHITRPSLQ